MAVVWEEQGHHLVEVVRFDLSLEELERVERAALRGSSEGTQLHVVLEKTYPSCEYVSKYFINRGHKVSYGKPDQVKEGRKFLWRRVKTDERDAFVLARLPYLDPNQLNRAYVAKRNGPETEESGKPAPVSGQTTDKPKGPTGADGECGMARFDEGVGYAGYEPCTGFDSGTATGKGAEARRRRAGAVHTGEGTHKAVRAKQLARQLVAIASVPRNCRAF